MYLHSFLLNSLALVSTCSFPLTEAVAGAAARDSQHVIKSQEGQAKNWDSVEDKWNELAMVDALEVMQEEYFDVWQGTWPSAIDWTAAVLGTHIPATLSAISALNLTDDPAKEHHVREDHINLYFSQLISFYYGQDWLALRGQANDDMLWVVLGWLEAVNFVQTHSDLRHGQDIKPWHGHKFSPAFAHRARIFWEIASKGWDETLCGGGMLWNPRLAPYKNAITNELYISASISMYLYFPGDDNDSPFSPEDEHKYKGHDKKYLEAAIVAYDWLMGSDMLNEQGLFVDGFHIDGWRGGRSPSNGTGNCDVRNEDVYTYNQGVILTGQRGLFLVTGNYTYIDQAHELIFNVIVATGWDPKSDKPIEDLVWKGMGRLGVLEDECDILGTCSQDGQTFKGVFFLHYAAFCKPLPDKDHSSTEQRAWRRTHTQRCNSYAPWVEHNARAASLTKDGNGLFGMWWTEGLFPDSDMAALARARSYGPLRRNGVDYRNEGVPDDEIWRIEPGAKADSEALNAMRQEGWRQLVLADKHNVTDNPLHLLRTPEIQSGGVSVLKADLLHRMK